MHFHPPANMHLSMPMTTPDHAVLVSMIDIQSSEKACYSQLECSVS